MTTDRDERWLEVLAGRREPDDAETRQAASVRVFFERQAADDMQARPDPEREKRLLNVLNARGVLERSPAPAAARPPAPAPARGNPLTALLHWLFPPGASNGLRYAIAAALVLGVALAPLLGPDPQDDSGTMKGAPPGPGLGANRWSSVDPAAEALRVQSLLASQGVTATVTTDGGDHVVEAVVPPDRTDAVRAALAVQPLSIRPDGVLRIRITAAR